MGRNKQTLVGVDTTFLIAHTVIEHPDHPRALELCNDLLDAERVFALCPTVLDEFIHVVTDAKRFERPLAMAQALDICENWLNAKETIYLFPCEESNQLKFHWLRAHRLGCKRINDTGIASIYYHNGAGTILTSNVRDYDTLDCFEIIHLSQ